MHNWKWRRKISWASFRWKRENLFFTLTHLNKVMAVHFESRLIPYHIITDNTELEGGKKRKKKKKKKKKKDCVRRWLAHIPDQFSADERVYRNNSVLKATRCFQRQFSNQKTVQTKFNLEVCQDSLRLNKNVGNRGCHHEPKLSAFEAHSLKTPITWRKLLKITLCLTCLSYPSTE